MTALEMSFLDAYKRLDAACTDRLQDKNGITAYLNALDTIPAAARHTLDSWSYDRSTLVRLRHVRNQIAHEAGPSSCTPEDLNKLKAFYDRLQRGEDALSAYTRRPPAGQPRRQSAEAGTGKKTGRRKKPRRKRALLKALAVFFLILFLLACAAVFLFYHH